MEKNKHMPAGQPFFLTIVNITQIVSSFVLLAIAYFIALLFIFPWIYKLFDIKTTGADPAITAMLASVILSVVLSGITTYLFQRYWKNQKFRVIKSEDKP